MSNTNGADIINNTNVDLELRIPDLNEWNPSDDETYMVFDTDVVLARYDKFFGLRSDSRLMVYVIDKKHYRERMNDACKVINYFLNFFDEEKELFKSTMDVKFIIDQKPNLNIKSFRNFVLDRVITDSFIRKLKAMTAHLYTINIDTDEEGKYKSTPKITNDQARLIVAVSFAIRCILPLCIHFSDTNNNFKTKKDYIVCFDKLFMRIMKKIEMDDIEIFGALCRFVKYRVDRNYNADIGICIKKKQLYGMTKEIYLEEVIHEVILVKSLYKLEYNRSVVSFIDGVIFRYHNNFKIENFKFKPVEIDENESNSDDERVSHKEAIEMSVYRIDESNSLINEVNTVKVIKDIKKRFNIYIPEEEIQFYDENIRVSPVTQFFVNKFYSRFFDDPNVVYELSRYATIELLIYMKKYLQYRGMDIIPQLCTAKVKGKYKENVIKNQKFLEAITTSSVWNNIIDKRYTYIKELNQKEDPIIKQFSTFINSRFEFVDYDETINGFVYDDIDQDKIINEFSLFLSIT